MMENSSPKNLEHLLSCKAMSGLPPQLRLSLTNAAVRVMEVNKLERKEDAEVCGFCFTGIDVTRAKVEMIREKKRNQCLSSANP